MIALGKSLATCKENVENVSKKSQNPWKSGKKIPESQEQSQWFFNRYRIFVRFFRVIYPSAKPHARGESDRNKP